MAVEFKTTSYICRFYIYQERWSPIIQNVNANLQTQHTADIHQR